MTPEVLPPSPALLRELLGLVPERGGLAWLFHRLLDGADPSGVLLSVARDGGRPRGVAVLLPDRPELRRPDSSPWLVACWVDPPLRRRGLGSSLVRALSPSPGQLRRTWRGNDDAFRFWSSLEAP